MNYYLLAFRQTVNGVEATENFFWRCWADDYEHAVEQLRDEVEHTQNEKLLYHEKLK